MKRVLMIRGLTLEVAPIFAAAAVSAYAPRFGAFAFVLAGLLILISASLSIRDGVVLASKAGILTYRRKEPVMFWFGMCIHFFAAAFCFFAAGISILRKT
jgi:hypothetical protein